MTIDPVLNAQWAVCELSWTPHSAIDSPPQLTNLDQDLPLRVRGSGIVGAFWPRGGGKSQATQPFPIY